MPYIFLCVGRGFSICLNEANSLFTYSRQALSFWLELWVYQTILYRNTRRQCHTHHSPTDNDKWKSTRKGFPSQRCWSLPIFLQASSPTQAASRDCKNQINENEVCLIATKPETSSSETWHEFLAVVYNHLLLVLRHSINFQQNCQNGQIFSSCFRDMFMYKT